MLAAGNPPNPWDPWDPIHQGVVPFFFRKKYELICRHLIFALQKLLKFKAKKGISFFLGQLKIPIFKVFGKYATHQRPVLHETHDHLGESHPDGGMRHYHLTHHIGQWPVRPALGIRIHWGCGDRADTHRWSASGASEDQDGARKGGWRQARL